MIGKTTFTVLALLTALQAHKIELKKGTKKGAEKLKDKTKIEISKKQTFFISIKMFVNIRFLNEFMPQKLPSEFIYFHYLRIHI